MFSIRPPLPSDAGPLNALYNHYISDTVITFDTEPWTLAQREAWMQSFAESGRYQLRIAEQDGSLIGYACSRRFREKAAYETSVELSVYVAPDRPRQGVGSALYASILDLLRSEDVHRLIGAITLPNAASIVMHERFGFSCVGVMTQVGRKFDRYWDVAWYEKRLR